MPKADQRRSRQQKKKEVEGSPSAVPPAKVALASTPSPPSPTIHAVGSRHLPPGPPGRRNIQCKIIRVADTWVYLFAYTGCPERSEWDGEEGTVVNAFARIGMGVNQHWSRSV
jgi:hypothetical protein